LAITIPGSSAQRSAPVELVKGSPRSRPTGHADQRLSAVVLVLGSLHPAKSSRSMALLVPGFLTPRLKQSPLAGQHIWISAAIPLQRYWLHPAGEFIDVSPSVTPTSSCGLPAGGRSRPAMCMTIQLLPGRGWHPLNETPGGKSVIVFPICHRRAFGSRHRPRISGP